MRRQLNKFDPNILVSSGPALNTQLLEQGLADRLILHQVEAVIGEGIRPFPVDMENHFKLTGEEKIIDGVTELVYQIESNQF